jgi:hypothetical protein
MKWEITLENKGKATLNEVKFIFEQAEKQLRETINGSNLIVTRTTMLLSVVIAILSALIGCIFSKFNSNEIDSILITAILLSIYLFCQTIYLAKNIKGQDYWFIGSEPDRLLHDYFFQTFPNKEEREIQIYISEIEYYQERIENNKKINVLRWNRFNNSIKSIVYYLPIITILLYIIIRLFFSQFAIIRTIHLFATFIRIWFY